MYAVVTDIPGDFLHADMVGTVYLILEGEVSEAIVNLEPETYKKFCGTVTKERQCYMCNSRMHYMVHYNFVILEAIV